ncbi:nucleoside deaminase [Aminobacter ciceronei]|jgi:guanine deaminase|uniref:nucleoside deaminase n=1 Tax=Aminobacter ciceronei TaxID=150723 RepID=UPI003F6F598C
MDRSRDFLCQAIELARANISRGGRPFGAVVVRNGEVIASGVNEVLSSNDPTAHAEMSAIRAASQALASPRLDGCTVYASGHPCPMCMGAMRMAGITEVAYAYSNDDGGPYGLSTAAVYADLARPAPEQSMKVAYRPVRPQKGQHLYAEWKAAQPQP